jgi:hypothetical protein
VPAPGTHASMPRPADGLRPSQVPAPGETAGLARSPLPDGRPPRRAPQLRPSRVPARASAGPAQRVRDTLRVSGQPLTAPLKAEMEGRLGADLCDVRLHTGAAASASAAAVGARAYASGSHVVIGDGGADKHTLAHELTHVVQQRQGAVAGTDYGAGLAVSDPADRFEREAEAKATRAMAGPAPGRPPEQVQPKAPPAAARVTPVQRTIRVGKEDYDAGSAYHFIGTLILEMVEQGYEETETGPLWEKVDEALAGGPGWKADSWPAFLSWLHDQKLLDKVSPGNGKMEQAEFAASANAVRDAFTASAVVVVAGEEHGQLDADKEIAVWQRAGIRVYHEYEPLPIEGKTITQIRLDAPLLRLVACARDACELLTSENVAEWAQDPEKDRRNLLVKELDTLHDAGKTMIEDLRDELVAAGTDPGASPKFAQAGRIYDYLTAIGKSLADHNPEDGLPGAEASAQVLPNVTALAGEIKKAIPLENPALAHLADEPKQARSASMLVRLADWGQKVVPPAIWKVGDSHIKDIRAIAQGVNVPVPGVRLMSRDEYLPALLKEERFQETRAFFNDKPIGPAIGYIVKKRRTS